MPTSDSALFHAKGRGHEGTPVRSAEARHSVADLKKGDDVSAEELELLEVVACTIPGGTTLLVQVHPLLQHCRLTLNCHCLRNNGIVPIQYT